MCGHGAVGAAIIGVHRVIGGEALGRCGRGDEARVLGYPILKALRSMNHDMSCDTWSLLCRVMYCGI